MTFSAATSQAHFGLIFETITSVVVGDVLLTGGFGTVMGTVFGVLTLSVVTQAIGFTEIDRNRTDMKLSSATVYDADWRGR